MKDELFENLNAVYKPLVARAKSICKILKAAGLKAGWAFYNGHYEKRGGVWVEEFFPIPVIGVAGLCDIELNLNGVSVSTKLKKDDALAFDYKLLSGRRFEMFGVENYLEDIYNAEISLNDICKNIESSGESEIGFAFYLGDEEGKTVLETVEFLKSSGFFY